jgi:hypothetical protein
VGRSGTTRLRLLSVNEELGLDDSESDAESDSDDSDASGISGN